MMPAFSFADWTAVERLVADHLWQSTLFAALAALVTLILRPNHARARYWVWLTASIKFLVPFGLLVAIGGRLGSSTARSMTKPELTAVVEVISQPFTQASIRGVAHTPAAADVDFPGLLPAALFGIWLVGLGVVVLDRLERRRRVIAAVRESVAVGRGRELEILRRLEQVTGNRKTIALCFSPGAFEPGVFGILRPKLLWPRGISSHLAAAQVEAVLAHEVSHVRRHDNLTAAVHMIVEALFWFHPLVWWIGARLIDERERACDESVVSLGSEPQVYAESLLKTCEFYVEFPLACAAGVTGSDLKKRIERIMTDPAGATLTMWKKIFLAAVAAVAVVGPLVIGVLSAPLRAQSQVAELELRRSLEGAEPRQAPAAGSPRTAFEVTSVKPNNSGAPQITMLQSPDAGWTATNVTLGILVRLAYQVQTAQIVGGPQWLFSGRFDVSGKGSAGADGPFMPKLQALLADRFHLVVHTDSRELPVHALVVARSDGQLGPDLHPAAFDCPAPPPPAAIGRPEGAKFPPPPPPLAPKSEPLRCGVQVGPGMLTAGSMPLPQLARSLSQIVGGIVVDKTGRTGNFDWALKYSPDSSNGPSVFTALQNQLGLELESISALVEVLVIDRAEQPTEN